MAISDWITAISPFALAFIAIFKDWILDLLFHPTLGVSISRSPPDCIKIPTFTSVPGIKGQVSSVRADTYYIRMKIVNSGNKRAELVRVFAAQLSKQSADGTFKLEDSFLPLGLFWSDCRKEVIDDIPPNNTYRYCDLAHVIDPKERAFFPFENPWSSVQPGKTILSLDTVVRPNSRSYLLPEGTYRLTVLISAANAKPVEKTLEISLTGEWYDDAQKMLAEGIRIRVL